MLELAACGAGFTHAWDRHSVYAKFMEVAFHRCLAVAAVGGDRGWRPSGAGGDPLERRGQLRGVWRVSHLDAVVEDYPVDVLDDLGFVAELDRLTQASFADRAGLDIVQADQPAD